LPAQSRLNTAHWNAGNENEYENATHTEQKPNVALDSVNRGNMFRHHYVV